MGEGIAVKESRVLPLLPIPKPADYDEVHITTVTPTTLTKEGIKMIYSKCCV